ncbi:SKI family transcriptional corepressor 1 isoform X1 [Cloeon dipterum]|uniref:SKI family transcriptional corepressor 1 isoform X1 n=1 Tax=Cloeon dipterum TaxID=197152 RepID=UPI00321FCE76
MEVGVPCAAMTLSSHHMADANRATPEHKINIAPAGKSNQCANKFDEHNGGVSQVSQVLLYGVPIVSLVIDNHERLCLAQISNTLLKEFSYNEIHNRRVALGITCVQCTPVQLEILRRAGAMPISSRRCGMITKREAERLCKSFLGDNSPPKLPDHFAFEVFHECAWGCRGSFVPSRYNSSRAKCIKCTYCNLFFSPNKFIFHSHRLPDSKYVQPDAANFNSWRRHMRLAGCPPEDIVHAWEDVKAMFNGGTRKRMLSSTPSSESAPPAPKQPKSSESRSSKKNSHNAPPAVHPIVPTRPADMTPFQPNPLTPVPPAPMAPRVPPTAVYPEKPPGYPYELHRSFVDYVWGHHQAPHAPIQHHKPFQFAPYSFPWLKRPSLLAFGPAAVAAAVAGETSLPEHPQPLTPPGPTAGSAAAAAVAALSHHIYSSAFRPVVKTSTPLPEKGNDSEEEEETVDIETTEDPLPAPLWITRPKSTSPTSDKAASPDLQDEKAKAEEPGEQAAGSPLQQAKPSPSPTLERPWALTAHEKRLYRPHDMARHLSMIRELASSPDPNSGSAMQSQTLLRDVERRARLSVQGRIKEAQNALHHLQHKIGLDCTNYPHAFQEASNISP